MPALFNYESWALIKFFRVIFWIGLFKKSYKMRKTRTNCLIERIKIMCEVPGIDRKRKLSLDDTLIKCMSDSFRFFQINGEFSQRYPT